MKTCLLCDIVSGKLLASTVYHDGSTHAFMDIQPVTPGHVLVVPTEHASYLADLDPETGAQIFWVAQNVAAAIRASDLLCEGVNFFLADGAAAGQEIFHVHLHVFPRYADDGFGLHYGPDYDNLPPREELDAIAGDIRAQL